MNTSTRFDIDLSFELRVPSQSNQESELVTGTIEAAGKDIVVRCDNPDVFLDSGVGNPVLMRMLADVLDSHDTTISFEGPQGRIVRIGKLKNPIIQRLMTGTRHIEFGSSSTLVSLAKKRFSARNQGDMGQLLPPPTLVPLLPTFNRTNRKRITTTNYAYGAGHPRLLFVIDAERWDGHPPLIFDLNKTVTTIGSSPLSDLVLSGAEPFHAEIRHVEQDEYVLYPFSPAGTGIDPVNTTASWAEGGVVLRTGARVQIAGWKMAFFREEYADHGRPYGGRAGGEWAHQRTQSARRVASESSP